MRILKNIFQPFGGFVIVSFAALLFVACNGKEPMPEPQVVISVKTLDASDVVETVATLNAKLELSGASYENLKYGFYWGSFNLGASAPEEYGLYYAWGELESKQDFYWSNYIWCNGSERSLIKYNSDLDYGPVPIDSKMILDTQDDVAHMKLGSDWRMPYISEWNELINNCTWQWTRLNGVSGYKVTSKKSGYTGQWIFLPAAGYWNDNILNHSGSQGLYWSLNRSNTSYMGRCMVCYYSWGQDYCSAADVSRNRGQSIRPVLP